MIWREGRRSMSRQGRIDMARDIGPRDNVANLNLRESRHL
jgi:hypothetical protein